MNPILEAKNEMKERLGNPIIGSVIISWMLFNWRVLICVLYGPSNQAVFPSNRIDYLELYFFKTSNSILIWLPFGVGTGLAFTQILLKHLVAHYPERLLRELRNRKDLIERNNLKELEEFGVLFKDLTMSANLVVNRIHTLSHNSASRFDILENPNKKDEHSSVLKDLKDSLSKIYNETRKWKEGPARVVGPGPDPDELNKKYTKLLESNSNS